VATLWKPPQPKEVKLQPGQCIDVYEDLGRIEWYYQTRIVSVSNDELQKKHPEFNLSRFGPSHFCKTKTDHRQNCVLWW
jgi:hypothetical protein